MIKNLMRIILYLLCIIQLSGCLDPNYYIWRDREDSYNADLPWSGINKKPTREYRRYVAPMSGTGYGEDGRWSMSFFDKKTVDQIDEKISKYLLKKNILKRWGQRYSKSGRIYKGNSPYELTMISINPIIITMRPYVKSDIKKDIFNLRHPEDTSYFYSDYLIVPIHYGTTFKYQPDLLYFSPDLDILPQPLNLKKGTVENIYWKKGRIEFTEKNGTVSTRRLDNKERKENTEKYDPDYHLSLIPREQEIMQEWKKYQKKNY